MPPTEWMNDPVKFKDILSAFTGYVLSSYVVLYHEHINKICN